MDPMTKHRPIPNGHRKYPIRPAGVVAAKREPGADPPPEVPKRWTRVVPEGRRFPRG